MNYNLLSVIDVTGNTANLSDAKVFELHFEHQAPLRVPRPVMLGIASFVQACYARNTEHATLHYNSRTFTLGQKCDFDTYKRLQPLYKWAIAAGMEYMHKTASRDYSKFEHFYRKHVARVPEVMDGYLTVVTEVCFDKADMQMVLDIEQRMMNEHLLDDANGAVESEQITHARVTHLSSAKERLITAQPLTMPQLVIHRKSSVQSQF
ncbi:hypothetical protein WELLINGTON_69 [Erwinia phage Wellington]|jgi:hypothetical protein|uniref:Uncharacterized protein n=1 Tax=Erwinia phage Wellington TaxID=2267653 RepID=A0A345BL78_9CAUD|nr:hypothetical protein HOT70_gp232 [Erwinia phage Wellington]AXF51199.1 hypothetical protein WELLINGTON_69 [Erwinia phage Wellington]